MANKNTIRLRGSLEKTRKCGVSTMTCNGGKWRGGRIDNQEKIVAAIREITKRIYCA